MYMAQSTPSTSATPVGRGSYLGYIGLGARGEFITILIGLGKIVTERKHRKVVVITAATAATAAIMAILATVLYFMPTIQDPTESSYEIYIVNDLSRPVLFDLCENDSCRTSVERDYLPAGESISENVTPHSEQRLLVKDEATNATSCRVLSIAGAAPGKRVRVSRLPPC